MTLTELTFAMFWLVVIVFGSVFFAEWAEKHTELCNGTFCELRDACIAMVRNADFVCDLTAEGSAEVNEVN